MSDRISITTINFKLNRNNHLEWEIQLENYLKGVLCWHHIKCGTFEDWRRSKWWEPGSVTEKRYWLDKHRILAKPEIKAGSLDDHGRAIAPYGETERDDELLVLEKSNDYKDDFKSFEAERSKDLHKGDRSAIYGGFHLYVLR